ncbi:MAG TPA: MarR family transcriptional regulator [Thermomicrobiales bacterium]|nr:MarR family transcriptional regulator [Thermomicrobiales bacterium]
MVARSEDTKLIFSAITHYRRWISALIPSIIPEVDVSYQQLNVLYYVRAEDASMADIARMLGVAPTVITGLVDRLEVRGLIRRESHPTDRRRIQLVLTEHGQEISQRVEEAIAARIEQQIGLLDPERQQHLRDGLMLFEQLTTELERQEQPSGESGGFSVA